MFKYVNLRSSDVLNGLGDRGPDPRFYGEVSSIFWMPYCQIQNSRTRNSRNTRTRNTRRPEQEIPNCQTCGSFLKEKKFRAYQKFFFISNTRAVLSCIPFICCIYQTSLAFLKYFTYLKIPYIPVIYYQRFHADQ